MDFENKNQSSQITDELPIITNENKNHLMDENIRLKKENEDLNKQNVEFTIKLKDCNEINGNLEKTINKLKKESEILKKKIEEIWRIEQKNQENEMTIINLMLKNEKNEAEIKDFRKINQDIIKNQSQVSNIIKEKETIIKQYEEDKEKEINQLKENLAKENEKEIMHLTSLLIAKTEEIENLENKMKLINNEKFAEETRREPSTLKNKEIFQNNSIDFTNEGLFELMEKKIENLWRIIEIIQEFLMGFKGLMIENEKQSKFIGEIKNIYEGFIAILQSKNEEFQQINKICKERKNFQSEKLNLKEEFIKIFHFGDDLVEKIYEKKGK